jgi:RNA polymerase sigma-70 factor, ECF subfamily
MHDRSPEQLERHRAALTGHCYRMLGSVLDAEDAVAGTMVRAWRGLPSFDGRASLRTLALPHRRDFSGDR